MALAKSDRHVLTAALRLHQRGTSDFHGYPLTKELSGIGNKMAYTTLYRSLARLEEAGMLTSRWELPEGRQQHRRIYTLTGEGITAAAGLDDPTITNPGPALGET
jgi:DNA-binding PadR family transcriptional regulator